MSQPMTPAELSAFRARQKSRSRALAVVLVALVVLFFAITLVKLREQAARYHATHPMRTMPAPATAAKP